jgi:hypothetical protein
MGDLIIRHPPQEYREQNAPRALQQPACSLGDSVVEVRRPLVEDKRVLYNQSTSRH